MKKRKIQSQFNGRMEVSMRDGRKVLDSANANYSYGTADDLWRVLIGKIDLENVKSILLFGLGGGTILEILDKDFAYNKMITVVEIDPVIIQIAREEFAVEEKENISIECYDAFNYVKKSSKKFDLVLVDISIDFEIPEQILSVEFWENLSARVKREGRIVFNALDNSRKLKAIKNVLSDEGFELKIYPKLNGTNNILFAKLKG